MFRRLRYLLRQPSLRRWATGGLLTAAYLGFIAWLSTLSAPATLAWNRPSPWRWAALVVALVATIGVYTWIERGRGRLHPVWPTLVEAVAMLIVLFFVALAVSDTGESLSLAIWLAMAVFWAVALVLTYTQARTSRPNSGRS